MDTLQYIATKPKKIKIYIACYINEHHDRDLMEIDGQYIQHLFVNDLEHTESNAAESSNIDISQGFWTVFRSDQGFVSEANETYKKYGNAEDRSFKTHRDQDGILKDLKNHGEIMNDHNVNKKMTVRSCMIII